MEFDQDSLLSKGCFQMINNFLNHITAVIPVKSKEDINMMGHHFRLLIVSFNRFLFLF